MRTLGVPNLQNMFLFRNLITIFESTFGAVVASTYFDT